MTLRYLDDPVLDTAAVGSKAAQLQRLFAQGVAVPPGFVVTHEVSLDALRADDLEAAVARIGGFPVAVRSSGLLEDLQEASFAGQYESFLNVGNVLDLRTCLQACRASAHSPRVVAYLHEKGFSVHDARVSVLVQQMVDAKLAGVGFSLDPVSGFEEHALVELCEGLGDKLVSGHVAPSRYVLALRGGSVVKETRGDDGALLSASQAADLAQQLLTIQAFLGHPQDVEWAIDADDRLWIVQARAITAVSFRKDVEEFTNADFKDGGISARVCTPLMFSLYRNALQVSMQRYFEGLKLIPVGHQETWIRCFYGRGYWNASAVKRALAVVPGFDERKFDEDLGLQKDYGATGPAVTQTTLRSIARAIPVALSLGKAFDQQLALARSFGHSFTPAYRRHQEEARGFTTLQNWQFWPRLVDVLLRFHADTERAYFTTIYNNSTAQTEFKGLLQKVEVSTGHKTSVTALMGGLGGVHHMDMQRGIVRLHAIALEYGIQGVQWQSALRGNLKRYGFHSDAELDLTVPRWNEVPERVTELISGIIASGVAPSCPDAMARKQRLHFEAEVAAVERVLRSSILWRVRFLALLSRNLTGSAFSGMGGHGIRI